MPLVKALRALVADDHPMCRQAESFALHSALRDCEIHEAANIAQAMGLATETDLILLDLAMPDGYGLAGLLAINSIAPDVRILVVTGNEQPGLGALVKAAGARGLVHKSAPITVLVEAILAVAADGLWFPDKDPKTAPQSAWLAEITERVASLTAAERRVLGAMCDGSLNKQIAYRFGLSEITIKQHVKAVLRKLNVLNRTQAALMMQTQNLHENVPH